MADSVTISENFRDTWETYGPLTRAVVIIDGAKFQDWKTVQVRLSIGGSPANTFRFTTSEDAPSPNWAGYRIRPGDYCDIILDGEQAMTGIVITRQAFYNAEQHTVEIQGAGLSAKMGFGAAVSKTGEYKNLDILQLAQSLAKPFGINVKSMGGVLMEKFKQARVQPGESAMQMLEKFARSAGAFISEDKNGTLLLSGGPLGGAATVVEGVNILEGREIIHSMAATNEAAGKGGGGGGGGGGDGGGGGYSALGQMAPSDDASGPELFQRLGKMAGSNQFSSGWLPRVIMNEIPAFTQGILKGRAGMDANVDQYNSINVWITTLGWQRNATVPPAGGLWTPGENVFVESPMLIMHRSLTLKAVTFSQDDQTGTRSVLELVNQVAEPGANPD